MKSHFFTSDTHFGHFNIIRYTARPFQSYQEMDEVLIANWNSIIKPNDIIWHLGDFAFCSINGIMKILPRLNGHINFVLGNHDRDIISNKEFILEQGKIESIKDYATVKINGQYIIMSHYAMRVWDKSHRGSIHCYGHSHGSLPSFGKSVDVGVDCKEITPEYRPIHFDELITFMSKRTFEQVDHHS